jgi:hypothetical protein
MDGFAAFANLPNLKRKSKFQLSQNNNLPVECQAK